MLPDQKQYRNFLFTFLFLISFQPIVSKDHIDLHLKWYHQFQFAGYYAALAKGYYQDAGLDVSIHESKNGLEGLHKLVSEKEARYGVGTNEVLLQWHSGTPIVVIAVIFQHSPTVLFTKKTHSEQSLQNLVGKKIMLSPHVYEILAYLKKEKLDPTNFIALDHSFRFLDLVEGKVDALDGYSTTQIYEIQKTGFPLMVFSPRTSGIDFYGDNLFTSQIEIQNHPKRVKLFREASLRGWEYAMENQEEIVELISKQYSNQISREQLLFEAKQMEPLIQPSLVELGYMYEGRWKHISEVYADFGMLPKNLDLNGFLYNPNPKTDYSLLVSIFISVFGLLLVIWVFQRYRWNKRYSENLKIEVLERTEEIRLSNETLNKMNQLLEFKLNELTDAQEKILISEKLATIGNLTAGMAHELNTPLTAIISSNATIEEFLKINFQKIVNKVFAFSEEDRERFHTLQKVYTQIKNEYLNENQENDLKKEIQVKYAKSLQLIDPNETEEIVSLIIDSFAYLLGENLNSILGTKKQKEILSLSVNVANFFRSSYAISIASERFTNVVKSLKKYLISDDGPMDQSDLFGRR
ncbi:ABC transporter substrate-binding protein [Leptospira biflexa]|uniref:ABC transporter substrate-binding protein n=1 Tax=Leptospira biflexa TaxID=172 RepID=UPI001F1740F6|nr:ABC transporter substrate-binding protein [Leptospira biflexa]